jgi:succinoglycan biosynthesis transport protein ExoP
MISRIPSPARLGVTPAAVDELDLGALGWALWSRRFLIIGFALAAAFMSLAAVSLTTPRYKSEARVLIETRENIFLRPEAAKSGESASANVDQEAVASQVQLLLSRDLARDVVKKLGLGALPEFDPLLRGFSLMGALSGFIGIGRDPMTMTPEERTLKSFQEKLTAYQAEKSRVIVIEFESQDPELAARAANAVAERYLILQQTAKQQQTRAASEWLAGEIDNLRAKVGDAEAKIERYRSETNLFIGSNNTLLSTQQLGEFNTLLSTARAQKDDAEAKARIIREALRSGVRIEFADIVNSELMRRLSEQRVTLRAQLAEQFSTLLDGHPRIKELRAQIADLETQMRAEADRLARSLENDAKLADARLVSLNATLEQLKRQASGSNEQDVQLRALERDAKSQRDLLESYLAKYREATARDSINAASADARVISTAVVSNTPSWPKKVPTVLVATLASFFLSAGLVLAGALLGGSRAGPAAEGDDATAPGTEPGVRPAIAAPLSGKDAFGAPPEDIETIARDLSAGGEGAHPIAVFAASPNVGTTSAAIKLARNLAENGRVVLIELSGSPDLSGIAADPTTPGLAELVAGTASFGQIITRDRFSRVHLITAGRGPVSSQEVVGSQRLTVTLEALTRAYAHVVVDAGPLPDLTAEWIALLAPRAVLIGSALSDPTTSMARERLLKAGFASVSFAAAETQAPVSSGTQAAA